MGALLLEHYISYTLDPARDFVGEVISLVGHKTCVIGSASFWRHFSHLF
jgi:hypothetical protein